MSTLHQAPEVSARAVARNVGELANDVIELGELQTQLFKSDTQEWLGRITMPMAVIGVGASLILGSIPLLLMALAQALIATTTLAPWAAYLIAGLVGATVGTIAAYLSWSKVKAGGDSFGRSREELASNIRWLKYVLQHRPQRPTRVPA